MNSPKNLMIISDLVIIFFLGLILRSCSLPTDNATIHYPVWQYGIFKINLDGISTQISNCTHHQMILYIDKTLLFFKNSPIKSFNYFTNLVGDIVSGNDFDYNGGVIVFTDFVSDDASLYKINLDTSDITSLTDNCSLPNFSTHGDEIIYYGKYSE